MCCNGSDPDFVIPAVIKDKYSVDIDLKKLDHQLHLIPYLIKIAKCQTEYASLKEITSVHTLVAIMQDVPVGRKMVGEVEKLLKIYLTIPVTMATAERSFPGLRRIKTYLRSTMTQQTLNNVMLLHTHKDVTDKLELISIARQFISANQKRLKFFGKI